MVYFKNGERKLISEGEEQKIACMVEQARKNNLPSFVYRGGKVVILESRWYIDIPDGEVEYYPGR